VHEGVVGDATPADLIFVVVWSSESLAIRKSFAKAADVFWRGTLKACGVDLFSHICCVK
jgi:hypothetical protein